MASAGYAVIAGLRNCARTGAALAALLAAPLLAQNPLPPPGCTGPESPHWLSVVVDGVRNSNGQIAVTLYADNPRKFLVRHGSLYVGRVNAIAGMTTACIFVPEPGVYALAIYHDENADQVFDRTVIGFPREGFGFSNNPVTLAGLPAFRSVRLNVPRSALVTRIVLKYP